MLLSILLLAGSLVLMTFGAEMLVRGAVSVAKSMGVSSFFIGLTIVGFGTSTPELATGITAALNGLDDINIGNVVGSNIFNIAVILGVTALIAPIPVNSRLVRSEALTVIGVSLLPFVSMLTGGVISRWAAAVMLAGLVAYIWRGYRAGRRENALAEAERLKELETELGAPPTKPGKGALVSAALIAGGLVVLVLGSRLLVTASVDIARSLGVSELAIALTIVAAGTSAPELFTSLVAALRRQSDVSVGNILGSNIFNVLGILAATSLVKPQRVSEQVLWMDAPLMVLLSVACLPIMLSGRRISRAEGAVLLAVYAAYLVALFVLAPAWFG